MPLVQQARFCIIIYRIRRFGRISLNQHVRKFCSSCPAGLLLEDSMVKIKVIGSPFIEADGRKVHLPLKKAEAIVYYLAVEGRSGREKLAYLLWGGKDESATCNNFRNALYLLRQCFPKGFIVSDRSAVSLGEAETDLSSIEDIRDISKPVDREICRELLSGFDVPESAEFEEWLLTARAQTRERIAENLKARITQCYDAEDTENLRDSLEKLLELDPFDEDSVLELMDLYQRQGCAAKAAALFRTYRTRLANDIGLAPSQRAEDLFRKIATFETDSENPESFFFGREKEQHLILKMADARRDRPAVVFVEGEAGVGKTSLVRKMVSVLNDEGAAAFMTMSYESGLNYPYSSWNSLVSQAAASADPEKLKDREFDLSLLAGVFPNFMSDRKIAYNADFAAVSKRTPMSVGHAVARLIALASSGKRPVVTVEDLHWFDQQSLHLLETVLTDLPAASLVFITSRPEKSDYAKRKLRRMEADGFIDLLEISLSPFDKSETLSFCARFLDRDLIESRDGDFFFRESEGLPLLIVELIKMLRANASADVKGGLGGVMLARLGEMPETHREFLRVLSVFTNGARVATCAEIIGEDPMKAAQTAEDLLERKLVAEAKTVEGESVVVFRHAKVRESVYEMIPSFKRSEYHRKAAEILSRSYSPQTWNPALGAMICYHYTKAGLLKNVLRQHLQEMIFDITLNHDLFPLIQDDVLLSCRHPYSGRADTEKKMDEVSDLLHTLNRSAPNDPEVLRMEASYLELRGGYLIGWGEYREGRIFINRAMQMAKTHSFNNIYIHCLMHTGHHFLQTDSDSALLACSREMLRVARGDEREKYIGIALRFIGVAFQIRGDFERSNRVFERSIEIFKEQSLIGKDYTLSVLASECYIGENLAWQGMLPQARERFEKCVRICEEKGLFWGCSHFHAHLADIAFDMDDMDMMYRHIDRGAEIFEKCQGGRCGSILYSLKAIADAKRGDYQKALSSLEIGELLSDPIQKKSWIAVHAMAKAYLAVMKEEGLLPAEFDKILTKSAKSYIEEASGIYALLHAPYRQRMIEDRFNMTASGGKDSIS